MYVDVISVALQHVELYLQLLYISYIKTIEVCKIAKTALVSVCHYGLLFAVSNDCSFQTFSTYSLLSLWVNVNYKCKRVCSV
jgi:hypothetical protein